MQSYIQFQKERFIIFLGFVYCIFFKTYVCFFAHQWQKCSPDRGPSVLSEKKMTMKFRLMLIVQRDCQARKQKPCRDLRTTADISDLYIRPVQTLINFNISLPSAPIPVWPGLTHITNSNPFKEKNIVTFRDFRSWLECVYVMLGGG